MEPDVARAVVIAIAAVEFVLWLMAFQSVSRAARERRAQASESAQQLGPESGAGTIAGSLEIDGPADELSSKLVERLVSHGLGVFGPVKITAADWREVVFEVPSSTAGAAGVGALGVRGGRVGFSGHGSRTRVDYAVETSSVRSRVLLGIGWLLLGLGLVALAAGLWLEFTFVLPSPQAGIRAQAVQMIQVIHLLWPPFLLAFLARQPQRMLRTQMEVLLNNLPYA